jgi:alkaline phosphatase
MKQEMVDKAIAVLETLVKQNPRDDGGWILLVEQSQSDKLGHILEYERAIYEVVELDLVVKNIVEKFSKDNRALAVVTADHAQPQTIIGVAMTSALVEAAGNCFQTTDGSYPVTLGAKGDTQRPCALQDAIGTFNDATFPTYADLNNDGFPDDPDPAIKLIIEDGGRPAYSTTYLTNYQPLKPSASKEAAEGRSSGLSALPNPARQPEGLFMSGNMPSGNVKGGANKTSGAVDVAPHSGDDVLVSAEGAGAQYFSGYYENTEILPRLTRALGGPVVKATIVNPSGKIVGW